MTSAWPTRVGSPVEGPPRCTLITTQGTSIIAANPEFSSLRENPGPQARGQGWRPRGKCARVSTAAALRLRPGGGQGSLSGIHPPGVLRGKAALEQARG